MLEDIPGCFRRFQGSSDFSMGDSYMVNDKGSEVLEEIPLVLE